MDGKVPPRVCVYLWMIPGSFPRAVVGLASKVHISYYYFSVGDSFIYVASLRSLLVKCLFE